MDPELTRAIQEAMGNEVVQLFGFFLDLMFVALGAKAVKKVATT